MSRALIIPLSIYLVLLTLLLAAQERYGWSNEEIGWPGLIIIGAVVFLYVVMKGREGAAKAAAAAADSGQPSTDESGGAAQPAPTRKASSST